MVYERKMWFNLFWEFFIHRYSEKWDEPLVETNVKGDLKSLYRNEPLRDYVGWGWYYVVEFEISKNGDVLMRIWENTGKWVDLVGYPLDWMF